MYPLNELQLLIRALEFAAHKHRDQRRKDREASPYINHPITLLSILANEGSVTDVNALAAALLHDTLEDTETTEDELRQLFGDTITDIVLEVTDDKTLPKAQRKQEQIVNAARASYPARLVKLADKIANLRDVLQTPPASWSIERKRDYFAWSNQVLDGLRGTHPELERSFDALLARGIRLFAE